jgi:hypothetical protein
MVAVKMWLRNQFHIWPEADRQGSVSSAAGLMAPPKRQNWEVYLPPKATLIIPSDAANSGALVPHRPGKSAGPNPQVDKTQLFDLRDDPEETTNLAGKPEHTARIAALTVLMEKEQKLFGDTAPLTVPNPKPGAWSPPKKTQTPP